MSTKTSVGLPVGMLFDPWLKASDLRVWAAYRHHADRDLETTVTVAEIADALCIHVITVDRAIANLTKAGYMAKDTKRNSSRRRLVLH